MQVKKGEDRGARGGGGWGAGGGGGAGGKGAVWGAVSARRVKHGSIV